jgi:hypothetical protein
VTDNSFTVLTAVVAPAILTNACSVLALRLALRSVQDEAEDALSRRS